MKIKPVKLFCLFFCFTVFAVQNNEFANIFDLAEFSACPELSKNILDSQFQISNFKLPASFSWFSEVTNGYNNGFIYYSLLGFANEQEGDIPLAYQCYRNATLYIDEEKSFGFPEQLIKLENIIFEKKPIPRKKVSWIYSGDDISEIPGVRIDWREFWSRDSASYRQYFGTLLDKLIIIEKKWLAEN